MEIGLVLTVFGVVMACVVPLLLVVVVTFWILNRWG